jgi:chromosome segregation ATPase
MKTYQESEVSAIEDKKKRLHYEQIRIQEERKTLDSGKEVVDQSLAEIDKKVYNDTKQQHQEKAKLDEMIEDINRDIEELMRVLERKKKEKDMLILEKKVHEHKIDQARMKYGDQISEYDSTKESLMVKIESNEIELKQWLQEKADLEEYEEHFNSQISKFKEEFKSLDEMEQYLKFNSVEIDQCNKERKEIRTKHNEILNQIQTLNQD